MDSLDLSSSPSMAATREGDSSAEDVGVLSAVASLRKDAAALYQLRKYAECADVLNQLQQKKEDDPKILHNIALAEFFRGGCSNPKKLAEALLSVKKKYEDLAHGSREEMYAATWPGNKSVSAPKGTRTGPHQISSSTKASIVHTDKFDSSLPVLNMGTALHVCLLLLDVALATQNVPKFADVINYLEKAFGVSYVINQVDNGSMGQQQLSNLVSKSSSVTGNASAFDDLNSDSAATGNTSEDSLSQSLSDETIKYETLLSTLDTGGQSLSRLSNLSSVIDLSRNLADRHSTAIDLKLKLPLYKVQLLLLTSSLKAAKREVKLAVNVARGRDSSRALLLKSQLEYARRNYPKAMKLLVASINEPEVGSSIILNNNYGCIYYQQQKHHTSSIFFHKALSNCLSHWKEKPSLSYDKSLLITYNCGLQYLSLGRPTLSTRCFEKAGVIFYNRPLLWLRFAECCLMALERGLLKSSATLPHRSEFKVHVIGQGKWRHLSTDSGFLRNGHVRDDPHEAIDCDPKLSMPFALHCLFNALHL